MYVYYERFFYRNQGMSIYVHQVTVHENCSQKMFDKLRKENVWKDISGKVGGKVYVRVLARRIRLRKFTTFRHQMKIHHIRVDNYLLNYSMEKDYED